MKGIRRTTTSRSSGRVPACPMQLSRHGRRAAYPQHRFGPQSPALRSPAPVSLVTLASPDSLNYTPPQTPYHAPSDPHQQSPTCPAWSRRATLFGLPFLGSALMPGGWGWPTLPAAAAATGPLRSLGWAVPCELTVLNNLEGPLKVYWLNYDGDAELFGSLTPGSVFTVRTFESHAWRFVDASSGATVAEHVAAAGQQVVRVAPSAAAAAAAGGTGSGYSGGPGGIGRHAESATGSYTYTTGPADGAQQPQQAMTGRAGGGGNSSAAADGVAVAPGQEAGSSSVGEEGARRTAASAGGGRGDGSTVAASFEGFDGLGNDEEQYTLAQLREIKIYPGGGNVLLTLPGSPHPLEVGLAGPEALSLVAATGTLEERRPSTLGTWTRSLTASGADVRRVCITRVIDGVYYCRIVLSRPDSSLCSLDATPGDSLSLALQLRRPIYVANEVARVHQSVLDVFARRRRAMEAAAARGLLDEAAEAEADREAQDALDSITRGLPAAPRPVRTLELEYQLDA